MKGNQSERPHQQDAPPPGPTPPRLADALLELFYNTHQVEEIQGDLYELFERRVATRGVKNARRGYWLDVLRFVRPFGKKRQTGPVSPSAHPKPIHPTDMLRNYLKMSLRSLRRNRTASAVSVLGLAVGLAGGLLLFLLVSYLFSFDRYHARADRTYWIVTDLHRGNVIPTDATPHPLGAVLRRDYPFVETAVRLQTIHGRVVSVPDGKGGYAGKFEESRNICFTEPQFFRVFDVAWVAGNPHTALAAPNTVVLSERYARKYFGNGNPLGRVLRFDNQTSLTVTGLVKDPPSNTQFRFDVFVSYGTIPALMGDNGQALAQWENLGAMCFVVLREGVPAGRLTEVFPALRRQHYGPEAAGNYDFHALPLRELSHTAERGSPAPRPILYALIAVGVLLVVAACINFVNLATARALKRAREIGVRKAVGGTRRQLVGQFLTETTLITGAAVAVALLLTQLCLPLLNGALAMLNANLSIADLLRPAPLAWFAALVVGVILLAGLYPALVQSGFHPAAALKGGLTSRQAGRVSVRKGLIVVQFFITQFFILGVVMAQLQFMKGADLGFARTAILTVPVPTGDPLRQETLRNRLLAVAGVEQVGMGDHPPASQWRNQAPFTFDTRTEPEKFDTRFRAGGREYVPVFGLKLVAGRNFRTNDTTSNEVLVNAAMVKALGLRSADEMLGKRLRLLDRDKTIVGVVADFHAGDFREAIGPVTLINDVRHCRMAALKIGSAHLPATVKAVAAAWNGLFPEHVFKPVFVNEMVNRFYTTERILLGLAQGFSLVAVLIGCLGLYGLVTFMAEAKTKEIGVRKVLGAGIPQLLWLFGREFGKLILLGFLPAAALGGFLMNAWLRGYAYRISLDWWVFALPLGLVAVITLLTVSRESLRAALQNPARSLRTE